MKVLFLGPVDSPLIRFLKDSGDDAESCSTPIGIETLDRHTPSFLVSYGYRHIIGAEVLNRMPLRAINLHISLLPWNRPADPNFWSFI